MGAQKNYFFSKMLAKTWSLTTFFHLWVYINRLGPKMMVSNESLGENGFWQFVTIFDDFGQITEEIKQSISERALELFSLGKVTNINCEPVIGTWLPKNNLLNCLLRSFSGSAQVFVSKVLGSRKPCPSQIGKGGSGEAKSGVVLKI